MKTHDLFQDLTVALTNEEADLLEKISKPTIITSMKERDQFVIENLIKKSVLIKVKHKNNYWVVPNEKPTSC